MNQSVPAHIGQATVLEVSGSLAGAFVGKLAQDLGARVVRAVPAGADDEPTWLDRGKTTVPIHLDAVVELAGEYGADAVIWDDTYGRRGPLPSAVRDAVTYSIELLGSRKTHGPWSEATLLAEAGVAHLTGFRDGPPIPLPGHQVAMLTGSNGFTALGGAIANKTAGAEGAHISLAAVEMLAGLHQFGLIDYVSNGRSRRRNGMRWSNNHPLGTFPCSDGFIAVCTPTDVQFQSLCLLLGVPEVAGDERFLTATRRFENADELDAIIAPQFAKHSRDYLFRTGNELGAPVAPVVDPDELLEDANLEHRAFWKAADGVKEPDAGVAQIPEAVPAVPAAGSKRLPLEGVRVVEFTKVWAGPLAGRALADLGADVVCIESPWSRGPEVVPPGASVIPAIYPGDDPGERPWNRQGIRNILNRSKKSVCLDIKDERARKLAQELCASADVILDNNRPRALDRSGLGYEAISELNPGVIFAAISGYGTDRSLYRDYGAYGPVTEALGGLVWWIRDERAETVPLPTGMGFPDPVIGAMATARIAAALNTRVATGRGEFIDLSQVECTALFLGDVITAWQTASPDERTWRLAAEPGSKAVLDPASDTYVMVTSLAADEFAEPAGTNPETWRAAGHAAAWDRDAKAVFESPELADFWVELRHPDVGSLLYDGNPFFDASGRLPVETFPSLGDHNRQVLASWLGIDENECARLEAEDVLLSRPRSPMA